MTLPLQHPPILSPKTGLLIINLGTPEHYSYWPMRRYLSQFLSDRRVIEINPLFWQIILQAIILSTRPSRSGRNYAKIWNHELNESPLLTTTRNQKNKLQHMFPNLCVDFAMRYGKPSIAEKLQNLKDQGCHKIIVFALYPQYSATTTASVHDDVCRALLKMRWQPFIRMVPNYHDHPIYIDSLIQSFQQACDLSKIDALVLSYHGLPKDYLLAGDPYHCQCLKTSRLIAEKLPHVRIISVFQSRFGRAEWLQPYAEETLKSLPQQGIKNIAMASPCFVSDCIETLEEINQEYRHVFENAGGETFTYIPCLNDSSLGMRVLQEIIQTEVQGWA